VEGFLFLRQYDPKRLLIVNQLLAILPEKFRKNKINGKLATQIKTPEPGRLASPFESIRSADAKDKANHSH
jgi:hypothetical protein